MTRTERNQYPAALLKDRHSRAGLNKNEAQRKQGAGAHNWGSFSQEGEYESQADNDAADERAIFDMENGDDVTPIKSIGNKGEINNDPLATAAAAATSNDVEGNKNAPQSPSDSMSSIDSANGNGRPGAGGRRMSNVSDEERDRARVYREGVMNKGGFDLAHIAKTSYGIAQSPPNTFSTSPIKTKNAFLQ